ncbi:hypothetical protein BD309DRAFT_1084279 [Dichomitus squalens]|uniref:Acyl-CoA desaturase n=1 Tax=Dichomitus squalens TaxID=114155 RepID=A0A4Q9NCS7_9APHY|nr:hypothetical protein BD309DRAFT_1084279 [Dichomitus squalens]TBU58565.1 hypothetical protein BD310DRAFT_967534 [Dichomitus squalens]
MSLFATFPIIRGVEWFNLAILLVTPLVSVYGIVYVPLKSKTLVFSLLYFWFSILGITAGYHRLWSHRAYTASPLLRWFLLLGGTSAVQGSCYWWARRHRSHHRYTDTDQDPYNSQRGLLWTHVGWMLFKTDLRAGSVDISDLRSDPMIQWQHRNYTLLLTVMGFMIPTAIPWFLWGDWQGGLCFSAALRMTIGHHSVFCINSIAHHIGEASYDNKLSPRDHFLSALLTLGEGYHNFHHQFPMDYRNAFHWYQYDPTKWFIAFCSLVGLASHLRRFPRNEIEKGIFTMKLLELKSAQDAIDWPRSPHDLPTVTCDTFQREAEERTLVLISGFVHDVSAFVHEHPGGPKVLQSASGKDMTAAFFGGEYDHSNAAQNLLSMMRVGILAGGVDLQREHPGLASQIYRIQETYGG